jgi:hypothetical protein
MFKNHRRVIATLVTAAAFMGTGTAFAYWTTAGTGTGKASVATPKPLVVGQVEVKGLFPGSQVALTGKVTNPNPFDVTVLNDFTVTPTVDADHQGCGVDNFQIVTPTAEATVIPASTNVPFSGGSITMVNSLTLDQFACYGATLTLSYRLK